MDEITRDDVIQKIHEVTGNLNRLQRDEFIMRLIELIDDEIPYSDLINALEESKDYVY